MVNHYSNIPDIVARIKHNAKLLRDQATKKHVVSTQAQRGCYHAA